jgi:hypothetical protein
MNDYIRITSKNNRRGIVCMLEEKEEMLEHYFQGHRLVRVTKISEAEYNHMIYGS